MTKTAFSAAFLAAMNAADGSHHLGSQLWLGWWLAKVDCRIKDGHDYSTALQFALEEAERIGPEVCEAVRQCLGS